VKHYCRKGPAADSGVQPSAGLQIWTVAARGRAPLGCFAALAVLKPGALLACATCYGQSDSPMAQGMNWGIMSLLVTVALVLASFALFFIYLARRAAAVAAAPEETSLQNLGIPLTSSFSRHGQESGLAGTFAVPNHANPVL